MYSVKPSKVITFSIGVFYALGMWHRGDKANARDIIVKFFHTANYVLYFISLTVGAIINDSNGEIIFLTAMDLVAVVAVVKLCIAIWRKREIADILNETCNFSVQDYASYKLVEDKLRTIVKFFSVLIVIINIGCAFATLIVPFFANGEKKLFYNIALPFDSASNQVTFLITSAFIFTGVYQSGFSYYLSIIIWYSMMNCALRITNDLASFYSFLFFMQLSTGAFCICCCIYSLTFVAEGVVEQTVLIVALSYSLSEIYMITNFGNEIKLASDRLLYCLFESDWTNQSQSNKKLAFTFGELLKQSHELVVAKLYPLSLNTFTTVLNLAYRMFNILLSL